MAPSGGAHCWLAHVGQEFFLKNLRHINRGGPKASRVRIVVVYLAAQTRHLQHRYASRMKLPESLRRVWLLTAQIIAISAGVLIAWRAFGPVPMAVPRADVMTVRQAAEPVSASVAGVTAQLESGFRSAARKASDSVVNVYSRKAPAKRTLDGWRPYGNFEEDPTQGQSSVGARIKHGGQSLHIVFLIDFARLLKPWIPLRKQPRQASI